MLLILPPHQHLKIPNLLLRKRFDMRICKRPHYSYSQTNRIYQQQSQKKSWTDIFTLKSLMRGHTCLWLGLPMMGCFQGKMFALPHCFTKKKDACPHSFCDIITPSR